MLLEAMMENYILKAHMKLFQMTQKINFLNKLSIILK